MVTNRGSVYYLEQCFTVDSSTVLGKTDYQSRKYCATVIISDT